MSIDPDSLRTIFPTCPDPDAWAAAISAAWDRFGITSKNARAGFLGIIGNESGGLTAVKSELSYFNTPWSRVAQTFSGVYGLTETVYNQYKALGREGFDEAFFNHVYDDNRRPSNRQIGNNTQPGDGYRFRGRGIIQLTGRANYTACGAALGIDLVNNPDALVSDPMVSAGAAAWFIVKQARILPMLDSPDENVFLAAASRVGTVFADGQQRRLDYRRAALAVVLPAGYERQETGNIVRASVSDSRIIRDSNTGMSVGTIATLVGTTAPVVTSVSGMDWRVAAVMGAVILGLGGLALLYFTKIKRTRRQMADDGIT